MSGRAEFQAWLTATAARRRGAALWTAFALTLGAFAAAFALIAGTDWLATPSGWPLVAMVSAATIAAAAIAAWAVSRAARRDDPLLIAGLADAERPDFQDRAKTAVDLMARPEKGAFDDLVLAETARHVSLVDLPVTTDERRAARGRRHAAAGALAFVIALVTAWPTLRDAGTTARVLMYPGSLELAVTPGDARVAIGRPFTIGATASIEPRSAARAMPILTIVTAGSEAAGEMARDGRAFSYVTPPVTESFTYRVSLGPVTSREYRVEALPFPKVEGIDLSYRYPGWSGLPPRDEKDGGDVYGPEGTSVRMRVRFDKPAREASLVMGDGTRVPLAVAPDGRASQTALTLARDGSYRIAVTDTDGLASDAGTEYFIRLMDDAPPDVRIVRPAGDQRVTPLAEVAVEARADDDHGVRSLELVYAVRGREERVVPIGGGAARSATGRHLMYLEDLEVAPGDFVSFYARARDVARGKQSTEGRSDIFFLEVKPFEEEFAAAQSMAQAGAGAASRQMQNLAAAQKEIIVATWKLERRSGAGRSSADLRAVAQAQRELRQRTAQAAQRAGAPAPARRGRRGGQGQVSPAEAPAAPNEEDPATLLARAGASMEQAASALDASRAKSALEHENAALNDLLKIEAQVRRTEIAQAQNQGGGGGGGGGNQDLSALFDRELQRQQQTNYENRASARAGEQQQQQEDESEALRRVREMAQRQEALRREQDALARANVSAEEKQRQLERLRRDQEQLQRQVDQLAKEMQSAGEAGKAGEAGRTGDAGQAGRAGRAGQAGQAGQAGRSGSAGSQGQSAREAADAMSEAAGSLGREELEQAGQQSGRAAESLRDLERELRARGARGQSQATNDARLEAQQIAEAQRRLADDAARVERDGATADAGRRIAGEKERIADRLEALGRQGGGNPQAAASARRLARAQRQGAEQWRAGQAGQAGEAGEAGGAGKAGQAGQAGRAGQAGSAGSAGSAGRADGERQMAAELEQLARAMGAPPSGAGEADARRLANELDEARATRERLADLERQINDLRRDASNPANARRLQELQGQFGREAGRAQGLAGGGTPEDARSLSRSAPGTEPWKQDFSRWDSMRRDVVQALESREAALASKLAEQLAAERVHGGYDARTPEAWRRLVAEYYQAIARRRSR